MRQAFCSQGVATNLKAIRKKYEYNQTEMGEIIGVTQSQYSKLEKGRHSLTACQLIQIAEWFRFHPVYWFTGKIVRSSKSIEIIELRKIFKLIKKE